MNCFTEKVDFQERPARGRYFVMVFQTQGPTKGKGVALLKGAGGLWAIVGDKRLWKRAYCPTRVVNYFGSRNLDRGKRNTLRHRKARERKVASVNKKDDRRMN